MQYPALPSPLFNKMFNQWFFNLYYVFTCYVFFGRFVVTFDNYFLFLFTMVSLESLRIGKTFNCYDDVLKIIDDLAEEQSYPLKILDSSTIETYNKKLSPHN